MSQSKPSTRPSNKGQRFNKNHNRVEEAVEEVPFITQTEDVISPVGRNDTTLVGTDEADDSHLDDLLIRTGFSKSDVLSIAIKHSPQIVSTTVVASTKWLSLQTLG